MTDLKLRAVIPEKKARIIFWLKDLINPHHFYIKDVLIPWLEAGNQPDRFTGLKDKNGNEIYENDIVEDFQDKQLRGVIEYIIDPYFVYIGIVKPDKYGNCLVTGLGEIAPVVIGNKHENTELLKVG